MAVWQARIRLLPLRLNMGLIMDQRIFSVGVEDVKSIVLPA